MEEGLPVLYSRTIFDLCGLFRIIEAMLPTSIAMISKVDFDLFRFKEVWKLQVRDPSCNGSWLEHLFNRFGQTSHLRSPDFYVVPPAFDFYSFGQDYIPGKVSCSDFRQAWNDSCDAIFARTVGLRHRRKLAEHHAQEAALGCEMVRLASQGNFGKIIFKFDACVHLQHNQRGKSATTACDTTIQQASRGASLAGQGVPGSGMSNMAHCIVPARL